MNTIWDEILGQETKSKNEPNKLDSEISLDQIPSIKLSDFAKLECAIKIRSKVLNAEVWLCSHNEMEKQINNEEPGITTYTISEIMELIKLNPNSEDIIKIHSVKEIFNHSKIINGKSNNCPI